MAGRTRLKKRDRAVELLALGEHSNEQVATQLGIGSRTLRRWLDDKDFVAELDAVKQQIRDAIRAEGIASKRFRIQSANDRHQRMQQLIEARAEANKRRALVLEDGDGEIDFEGYAAAGAETGLLVHTVTYLKDGRREEWAFDSALAKAMLDHEKQIAIEVGEWSEKRELTGKDGKPLQVQQQPPDLSDLTDEELETLERIAARRAALANPGGAGAASAG